MVEPRPLALIPDSVEQLGDLVECGKGSERIEL